MRSNSSTNAFIQKFNSYAEKNAEYSKCDPYASNYERPKFDKSSKDYGRPLPGTKTAARGVKAGGHVTREIIFLCELIEKNAKGTPPNCVIKFGSLFYIYQYYSDKLVGMLLRARKYGLVEFEGEMLYQKQDDNKNVRLLKTSDEIREIIKYSGDPANCIEIKQTN